MRGAVRAEFSFYLYLLISRGLYVGRWHCIDRKRVHFCADLCHIHGHIVGILRYECITLGRFIVHSTVGTLDATSRVAVK